MKRGLTSPFILILGRVVSALLMLVYVLILAKELGAAGRGITASLFAISASLPSLFALGTPLATKRRARLGDVNGAVSDAIGLIAAASPVILATGVFAASFFTPLLTTSERSWAIGLLCLVPIQIFSAIFLQVLFAKEKYLRSTVSLVSQPFGMVLVAIVLSLFDSLTITTAIMAQGCGLLLIFLLSGLLVRPKLIQPQPFQMFRESRSYWLRDIFTSLRDRLDQIIALPLLGPVAAGTYSVATAVASLPLIVGQAIGIAVFQRTPTEVLEQDTRQIGGLGLLSGIAVLTAGISAILPLFFTVPILFGQEFAGAVGIAIVIMLITNPIRGLSEVTNNILNLNGRGRDMSLSEVLAVGVGTLTGLGFGYFWGGYGLAAGFTLGSLFAAQYASHRLGLTTHDYRISRYDLDRFWRVTK